MIRYPLDAGVGKDHVKIVAKSGNFGADVAEFKREFRVLFAGAFNHIRELSTPITAALEKRLASTSVLLPGPQPMSTSF